MFPEIADRLDAFGSVAKIPYMAMLNNDESWDNSIFASMKQYGFFYVVDVPEYSADEEHVYMKKFFELDDDVKDEMSIRRHNPANKNAYRGLYFDLNKML